MARVPVYQQQVEPRPIGLVPQSDAGASSAAFGGVQARQLADTGAALSNTGDQLAKVAIERQIQDNERAAKALDIEYSKQLRILQYGDGTAENPGYYSLRGDDAIQAAPGFHATVEALQKRLVSSNPNPRVQEMFGNVAAQRTNAVFTDVDNHVIQQRKVANDTVDTARLQEFVDDASMNPSLIPRSIAGSQATIQEMARRNGITDPATIKSLIEQNNTAILRSAIKTALQRDLETGKNLYTQYQGMVDGEVQGAIEQDILVAEHAAQAEEDRRFAIAERNRQLANDAATREYATEILGPNGDAFDYASILNDPRLTTSGLTLLDSMYRRVTKADSPTELSAAHTQDLYEQIYFPDGHPHKMTTTTPIDQAFADGRIDREDHDWLIKQWDDYRTPEGKRLGEETDKLVQGIKPQIDHSNPFMGQIDQSGAEQLNNYRKFVADRVTEARKNGEDPYELFNVGSPKYLGRPEVISRFQTSLEESLIKGIGGLNTNTDNLNLPTERKADEDYKSIADIQAAIDARLMTVEEGRAIARKNGLKP